MEPSSRSPDDSSLVRNCKGEFPHSTRSFEILLRRYESDIYRFCLHYLRDHHDAEEVSMDAFSQAYFRLDQLHDPGAFKAWIFRIAGRLCASRYRNLARRRMLDEAYTGEMEIRTRERIRQEGGQPVSEAQVAMDRALSEVAPRDREILILRHVNELSFDEIAETLRITESAAKMRLYRAEERLRKLLQPAMGRQLSPQQALLIFLCAPVTFGEGSSV